MNDHHRHVGDARIKFSLGTKQPADTDGLFHYSFGLLFDSPRGLLLAADSNNHRVQVFSSDDGSLVSKFGGKGDQPGQFQRPSDLALADDLDRIFIIDAENHRIQARSWANEQSFLSCIGRYGSRRLEFKFPRGITIDRHHRRLIVVDTLNQRLVFLSLTDLSFLFSIGDKRGSQPRMFYNPSGAAVDHDRDRIVVTDTCNHRLQVLSSIDGSFLFEFGEEGDQPGQLSFPHGVCIDNQGRIIVADSENHRLQAFTHEGHHISSFTCDDDEQAWAVAFDEQRGLIAFSAGHRVHVIGANQWLPDTAFIWRPDRHRYAPSWMKQAISTMTMIRSLVEDSAMSMIPNELLFEIFAML